MTNAPPVITSVTATPASILLTETAALRATVSDPDGDSVTCTWSLDAGGEIAPAGTGGLQGGRDRNHESVIPARPCLKMLDTFRCEGYKNK